MNRMNEAFLRWVKSGLQSIWNSKGKTEEFNIYKVWFYRLKGMLPLSKNIHSKKQTIDEALTYIKALSKALDLDIFTSSSLIWNVVKSYNNFLSFPDNIGLTFNKYCQKSIIVWRQPLCLIKSLSPYLLILSRIHENSLFCLLLMIDTSWCVVCVKCICYVFWHKNKDHQG